MEEPGTATTTYVRRRDVMRLEQDVMELWRGMLARHDPRSTGLAEAGRVVGSAARALQPDALDDGVGGPDAEEGAR